MTPQEELDWLRKELQRAIQERDHARALCVRIEQENAKLREVFDVPFESPKN